MKGRVGAEARVKQATFTVTGTVSTEVTSIVLVDEAEGELACRIIQFIFRIIFTAHKRSFGQGNVFTSVCQSFCSPNQKSAGGGEK